MKPFGKASRHCSVMLQASVFSILLIILSSTEVLADDQQKSRPDKHEIVFMTASRIEELILAHKITSAEVVDAYIEKIKPLSDDQMNDEAAQALSLM